ncbi:hypothetical protein P879_07380 [Paragonimus westermani]|uniref:RRM domain-containing protein n=1 Tax=Paragonimus westermani TaxID=34504 RepID=A0A8T0D9U9_9TREM|nr:hypothetical protein P879_07380 [Paragonimus westermani]
MNTCVPAESHENVLEPVDDALELDASDSDVEAEGDTSTNTVVLASSANDSTLVSPEVIASSGVDINQEPLNAVNDKPTEADLELSAEKPRGRKKSDASQPSLSVDSSRTTTEKPAGRRRQWGSSGHDRIVVKSKNVASDSLEKPVHTLTCEAPAQKTPTFGLITGNSDGQTSELTMSHSDGKLPSSDAPSAEEINTSHVELEVDAMDSMDTDESAAVNAEHHNGGSSPKKPDPPRIPRDESKKSDHKRSTHKRDNTNASQDNSSKSTTKRQSPIKRKGPKETKAVGYLVEPPERVDPFQPAKHRPTDIVYIRCLVRPFTADQLRQMISDHFGPVADLWLDRIKSTSLVRLDTVDTATRCREGLDGSRWPSMNPRTLRCDFGNEALFAWMKEHGNSGDQSPPKYLVLGEPEASTTDGPTEPKRVKKPSEPDLPSKRDARSGDLRRKLERAENRVEVEEPAPPCVKPSDPIADVDAKKKTEEPAKLLDDLFRKTEATACIYWLPLTQEQAEKQAAERAREFAARQSATTASSRSAASARPIHRDTRSPFACPGPVESSKEPVNDSRTDRPKMPTVVEKERTDKIVKLDRRDISPADPRTQPKKVDEVGARAKSAKSPPLTLDPSIAKKSGVTNKPETDEPRKRERSPFTPVRAHTSSTRLDSPERNRRSNPSLPHNSSHRNRSGSHSGRKPRPARDSRTARSRRSTSSRSPSSTGPRVDSRRRPVGGGNDPRVSSRYARQRSRSVERRAISPPIARSRGRSHR